ncbi:MAG: GNAT family protein [Bacteroidia bacterium]
MGNKNWIHHPTELIGKAVKLIPLNTFHFEEICTLAKEKSIWTYSPIGVDGYDNQTHIGFLEKCIMKRNSGEFYPFVVILCKTDKVIGFTIYHSINNENRSLEIGCTWFHPDYWSTNLNTECKYLMLKHCFETLETIRIQLKANDNNIRSRKAIEKIGGKFEGILRKDKILEDVTIRNAAYYSIIDDEWVSVKVNLMKVLNFS